MDLVRFLIDLSVLSQSDPGQLVTDLNLLWRNIVLVPGPCIVQREIVFAVWPQMLILKQFFRIPRAMVQIQEHHLISLVIDQEYILWVQICMHNVLDMKDFEEVNNLKSYIDGLVLCE